MRMCQPVSPSPSMVLAPCRRANRKMIGIRKARSVRDGSTRTIGLVLVWVILFDKGRGNRCDRVREACQSEGSAALVVDGAGDELYRPGDAAIALHCDPAATRLVNRAVEIDVSVRVERHSGARAAGTNPARAGTIESAISCRAALDNSVWVEENIPLRIVGDAGVGLVLPENHGSESIQIGWQIRVGLVQTVDVDRGIVAGLKANRAKLKGARIGGVVVCNGLGRVIGQARIVQIGEHEHFAGSATFGLYGPAVRDIAVVIEVEHRRGSAGRAGENVHAGTESYVFTLIVEPAIEDKLSEIAARKGHIASDRDRGSGSCALGEIRPGATRARRGKIRSGAVGSGWQRSPNHRDRGRGDIRLQGRLPSSGEGIVKRWPVGFAADWSVGPARIPGVIPAAIAPEIGV